MPTQHSSHAAGSLHNHPSSADLVSHAHTPLKQAYTLYLVLPNTLQLEVD